MPHLAKPPQADFIDTLLKKPLNNLMRKIIYSAIEQHYKIDKIVYVNLLGKLIAIKDPIISRAVTIAVINITNETDMSMQGSGLALFIDLVTAPYPGAFKAATMAATTAVNYTVPFIRNGSLTLFKALIIANQHQLIYDALKDFTPQQFSRVKGLYKLFNSLPKPKDDNSKTID